MLEILINDQSYLTRGADLNIFAAIFYCFSFYYIDFFLLNSALIRLSSSIVTLVSCVRLLYRVAWVDMRSLQKWVGRRLTFLKLEDYFYEWRIILGKRWLEFCVYNIVLNLRSSEDAPKILVFLRITLGVSNQLYLGSNLCNLYEIKYS